MGCDRALAVNSPMHFDALGTSYLSREGIAEQGGAVRPDHLLRGLPQTPTRVSSVP